MRPISWLSPIRRHIRLQNAMVVLCAVLVGAYGASMYTSLRRAHDQAMADAVASLESVARSVEVDTNRSLFEIDAMLLGAERLLDALFPDTPMEDRAVRTLLSEPDDQTLAVRDLLILDAQGGLVNKAVSVAPSTRSYADEPFFKAHLNEAQSSLYIGPPQHSRATGGWSV